MPLLPLLAPPTDYAAEVLADTPLGYWRFGETSGTTAFDDSGNGRHGTYAAAYTLGAPSLVSGDANTAVDFAVTDGRVSVPHAAWMDVNHITLAALIKPDAVNRQNQILDRDDVGGVRCFQFRVNSSNKLEFIWWTTGAGPFFATGSTTIAVNTRYHVAATFDGTTARVYLNGTEDGTGSATGNMRQGTTPLTIGKGFSTPSFEGVIDEPAYYATALSSARILTHAQTAGLGGGTTSVTSTRSTTWDVNTAATSSRATTWDTLATVTASRATTWDVRTATTASRATPWDALSQVTAARSTTWRVRAAVTSARATTWDARTSPTATRSASWDTLARIERALATSWDVRTQATSQRSTTWNVDGTLGTVTGSRPTSWRVRATATGTRAATWDTRALAANARATTWDVRADVARTNTTTWRTLAPATSVRATTWDTRGLVTTTRGTTWEVVALVTNFEGRILAVRLSAPTAAGSLATTTTATGRVATIAASGELDTTATMSRLATRQATGVLT